eukprot:2791105-Amphidinium_carterae.1
MQVVIATACDAPMLCEFRCACYDEFSSGNCSVVTEVICCCSHIQGSRASGMFFWFGPQQVNGATLVCNWMCDNVDGVQFAIWFEVGHIAIVLVTSHKMDVDSPEAQAQVAAMVDEAIKKLIVDLQIRGLDDVMARYDKVFRERAVAISVARFSLSKVIGKVARPFEDIWQNLWDLSFKGKVNREKEAGAMAARPDCNQAEGEAMTKAAIIITMTYMAETREALEDPYNSAFTLCTKKQAKRLWNGLLDAVSVLSRKDDFPPEQTERGEGKHGGEASTKREEVVRHKAMPHRKGCVVVKKNVEPAARTFRDGDLDETSSSSSASTDECQILRESGKHALLKSWYGVEFLEPKVYVKVDKPTHAAWSSFDMDDATGWEDEG